MSTAENIPVWGASDAAAFIRVPTASDDKYSHGVLGVVTGSERYPGAAVLGVEAAHRTGVGMVRYFGPENAQQLVLARRPEVVTVAGRVQAWLIGSGMDASQRTDAELANLRTALESELPVVVDAGALDLATSASGPVVITPHARELASLLQLHAQRDPSMSLPVEGVSALAEVIAADPAHWSEVAADELGAVVLLKGNVTHVASPAGSGGSRFHVSIPASTTWLATAGSGDVLAGILGALLATSAVQPQSKLGAEITATHLAGLAATAVLLHGYAAEKAMGGGPIAALDIAVTIPAAVKFVLGEIL